MDLGIARGDNTVEEQTRVVLGKWFCIALRWKILSNLNLAISYISKIQYWWFFHLYPNKLTFVTHPHSTILYLTYELKRSSHFPEGLRLKPSSQKAPTHPSYEISTYVTLHSPLFSFESHSIIHYYPPNIQLKNMQN